MDLFSFDAAPQEQSSRSPGSLPFPDLMITTANFEICSLLEDITTHLDRKEDVNMGTIVSKLTRLQRWSKALPFDVRVPSAPGPLPYEQRQQALGILSVACLYYFSVILLTRQTLISTFTRKLTQMSAKQSRPQHTQPQPPHTPTSEPTWPLTPELSSTADEITQVCIDAAALMADTARSAHTAGILIQNMCMLK
jgi:hypothetical protein